MLTLDTHFVEHIFLTILVKLARRVPLRSKSSVQRKQVEHFSFVKMAVNAIRERQYSDQLDVCVQIIELIWVISSSQDAL